RHLSVRRYATQRRHAEEERTRLIAILDATTDIVGMTSADGQFLYINHSGRTFFGLRDNEDLSRRHIAEFNADWSKELITTEGIPTAVRDQVWEGETSFIDREGR